MPCLPHVSPTPRGVYRLAFPVRHQLLASLIETRSAYKTKCLRPRINSAKVSTKANVPTGQFSPKSRQG